MIKRPLCQLVKSFIYLLCQKIKFKLYEGKNKRFALGTLDLVWFVFGLKFGWSIEKGQKLKN
jgi:hypothetical protein